MSTTCEACWDGRHYKCRGCQCSVCLAKRPKVVKVKDPEPAKVYKAKRREATRKTVAAERRARANERQRQREKLIARARVLQRTGMSDTEVAAELGVKPSWIYRNVNTTHTTGAST